MVSNWKENVVFTLLSGGIGRFGNRKKFRQIVEKITI